MGMEKLQAKSCKNYNSKSWAMHTGIYTISVLGFLTNLIGSLFMANYQIWPESFKRIEKTYRLTDMVLGNDKFNQSKQTRPSGCFSSGTGR